MDGKRRGTAEREKAVAVASGGERKGERDPDFLTSHRKRKRVLPGVPKKKKYRRERDSLHI